MNSPQSHRDTEKSNYSGLVILSLFCHPERSEGSAVRRHMPKLQIPHLVRDDNQVRDEQQVEVLFFSVSLCLCGELLFARGATS
jgi:hypothetical protein